MGSLQLAILYHKGHAHFRLSDWVLIFSAIRSDEVALRTEASHALRSLLLGYKAKKYRLGFVVQA